MSNKNYQVLARKYRPSNFNDLIGQETLVRTLSNAIKMNRLAHAFLLTGTRGIGKTTTARIMAKSINCSNLDKSKDIIKNCGNCPNCRAYEGGSHLDIIEIDAASKTGVNDIREIIENCNYLPQLGAFKLFIIDEIHMLSNNAFNALLKTLEEPPPHIKFIFATTEIKKIPITILSRCQKFDLKTLTKDQMVSHLSNIASKENILIDNDCLNLIAKNAQGSIRDGLSLLDQAIAMSFDQENHQITLQIVMQMLGVSDKEHIFSLLNFIVEGKIAESLKLLNQLYDLGADLILVINELFELIHQVSKVKITEEIPQDLNLSDHYQMMIKKLAKKFDLVYLTTIWQIAFKGLGDLRLNDNILNLAEMIIIKMGYVSCLPSPIELITSNLTVKNKDNIIENEENYKIQFNNFIELIELFKTKRELLLYHQILESVSFVRLQSGKIEINLNENAPKDLVSRMTSCLNEWTNIEWRITISSSKVLKTIKEQQNQSNDLLKQEAKYNDVVNLVLDKFPGSTIINVQDKYTI